MARRTHRLMCSLVAGLVLAAVPAAPQFARAAPPGVEEEVPAQGEPTEPGRPRPLVESAPLPGTPEPGTAPEASVPAPAAPAEPTPPPPGAASAPAPEAPAPAPEVAAPAPVPPAAPTPLPPVPARPMPPPAPRDLAVPRGPGEAPTAEAPAPGAPGLAAPGAPAAPEGGEPMEGAPRRPPSLRRPALSQVPPGQAGQQAQRKVTMNFKDAEIEQVVKFISDLTGKNFILDEKVRGKITVISPSQLSIDEAYQVFQAILEVKGFTVVPTGKVYKIVATRDAKQTSIETVKEPAPAPPGDRYVTRILRLKFLEAGAAAGILAPLVSKDGSVVPYGPTNTLIITDSYNNIQRLQDILEAFDVETQESVLEIIRIQYASADAVSKLLLQAVAEKARGAAPTPARRGPAPAGGAATSAAVSADGVAVRIIPDPRTNSVIVIADPATLQDIRRMIAILDVEMPRGSGKINVYYLKYADAENIASVLTAISKTAPPRPRPGQPGQPGQPATPTPAVTGGAISGQVSLEFEEPVQITADKTTNSLVIIATPGDFELLRSVIAKLDVRRPQVLVEALILEMSYNKSLEFGVEWRTTNLDADTQGVVAASNFGGINNLAQNPLGVTGLVVAAVDGTITFAGRQFLNIGALVRALQGTSDANILSTPHLLTTDNEEAEIVVSQNIPYQTSQKFDNNGNPINTFDYKDVGLTLRLTPQINDDSYVKLKLFQEISQLISQTTGTVNAPSTTKRSAKTTIVVKDASTVVIGGLVQDTDNRNVSSVPCLGDIPVFGHLFKSTTHRKDKTNLLIFLTPHVIRSAADLDAISRVKREGFRQNADAPEAGPRTVTDKMDTYMERPASTGGPQ